MANPYLTEAVEAAVNKRTRSKRRPEQMAEIMAFAEATVVDWMGPGGDEAFLDFYCLANSSLPPMNIVFVPRFFGTFDSLVDLRRHQMFMRVAQAGLRFSTENVKYYAPKNGKHDPRNDALLRDAYKRMSPTMQKDMLVFQQTTAMEVTIHGLTSMTQEEMLAFRHTTGMEVLLPGSFVFYMVPYIDYRTLLMGELAQPWEVLPPPYGPYVPGTVKR